MGGPANLSELQKSKKVFESRLDGRQDILNSYREKGLDAADVHRHA